MLTEKSLLTEKIDKEYLQRLQDSISEAANVTTIMLDSSGVPITKTTNARGLCRLLEDTHRDGGICRRSQMELYHKAFETRKPASMVCPVSGMTGTSIPIFSGDLFLGVWIIGQIRFQDEQTEPLVRVVQSTGIAPADASQLLEEIPIFSRSEFEMVVNFMYIITGEIVKLTSSNIEINEKNEQLTELAKSLKHSMEALRAFADTSAISIYITDFHTGKIIMCNNAYANYFGKPAQTLVGTYCFENLGFTSRCPFCPHHKLLDESGNPLPPYVWENHFEMFQSYLQITSRAVHWVDGRLINMSVSIDITERKKMEDELYTLAFFDRNLQIPNSERMEQDILENSIYEYLVVVSLTDFRRINNIFGRSCGDALLRSIRDYILEMNILESTLYKGRLGDFLILLKGTDGDHELPSRIAEKICDRCKKAWEIPMGEQRQQNIFTSVNACVLPLDHYHERFFDYLYSAMEHCLDISRRIGSVVVYDADARERFHANLELELSLKNAVRENMRGFYVVYQPIVDVEAAIWKGVEALCRWESPEFGSVPPSVFIPMAESSGLIGAIGLWILEQSIMQMKVWGLDLIKRFILEVNLSPIQLSIPNLDRIIVDLLKKYDYPPEKLGLEVTETSEMNFSKQTMEAIVRLGELGVIIVLDDFGTGYSSFNTLHKLPVKMLKTDRTFISGMESDSHLQNLLSVMVSLAHSSGMKLVAEGVETDVQVRFLFKQGTDFFQGYFFSHPLTAQQMEKKLDNFYYPITYLVSMELAKQALPKPDESHNQDEEYKIRENVLDNINILIYVSDLETNKILFASAELQRIYGPLEGRVCWEALQNREGRCPFCPIPYLLKNPGKNCHWEFFNEILERRFQIQDSIIPWVGGKLAHLEYAVDITDFK